MCKHQYLLSIFQAKQLHARLILRSMPLPIVVVRSYAVHGDVVSAERLLTEIPHPTAILYNSLIRAHALRLEFPAAFRLFVDLQRSNASPDEYSFACVLRASADSSDLRIARTVHGAVLSFGFCSDLVVSSALVSTYSKLEIVDDARRVFDGLCMPDLVLWNSMMSGYGYQGMWREGFLLFHDMRASGLRPDGYSLVSLVSCFWNASSLATGEGVHALCIKEGLESNCHLTSAILSMYLRCGSLQSGYNLFKCFPKPDLVTWSALITGFLLLGKCDDSLRLFRDMNFSGKKPDVVLTASVLSACAALSTLRYCKETHCCAIRLGLDSDVAVSSALLGAYAKCGLPQLGFVVFGSVHEKNAVLYNAMISNLVSHGLTAEAMEVLEKMLLDGFNPDTATFSVLLGACCHSGLLEQGLKLFHIMRSESLIELKIEHYVYMVRLLAKFGMLTEAYEMIQMMSMPADCGIWGSLLWGCHIHGDKSMGKIAAEKLFQLNSSKVGDLVMLSNLYASKEMWLDVEELRDELSTGRAHKFPGTSRIDDKIN